MNIQQTKADLAAAIVNLKKAKAVIAFETRQLISPEDIHELKELALIAGADVATIESHLGAYSRVGRKFVKITC